MASKPGRGVPKLPHFRARKQKSGRIYYYFDTGAVEGAPRREIPLGSVLSDALIKYAQLKKTGWKPAAAAITFGDVAKRYMAEVVPKKARSTQLGNEREMEQLLAFFDNPPAPLDLIEPKHIRLYLDSRSGAPVRANREKALFSHVFNKAREWGYTRSANPCAGIKANRERGRSDVYVEDDVYAAVYEHGDQLLRDAMDMAYLTAQRPGDVTRLTELDLKRGLLIVNQEKVRARVPFRLDDEATGTRNSLGRLIDKLREQKANHARPTVNLLCVDSGQPLTLNILRNRFVKARSAAASAAKASAATASDPRVRAEKLALADAIKSFQFRDLRAKAGTDTANRTGSLRKAQVQLGHKSQSMTEAYVRGRKGDEVDPTSS